MSAGSAVRSMTGFARAVSSFGDVRISVEIRSVNHRFLEVNVKAPRGYAPYERELKGIFQQTLKRGRVDVLVLREVERSSQGGASAEILSAASPAMEAAVQRYVSTCRRFGASGAGLDAFIGQLLLRELSRHDEGDDNGEISSDEVAALQELLSGAAHSLVEMRRVEGESLVGDILARLGAIGRHREEILVRSATAPQRLRERLLERLAPLVSDLSLAPDRVAQEAAVLADRVDTSEELARLEIHLAQFEKLLRVGHPDGIGRKLDFMTQEIGRELNTISSKAQDAVVQQLVVEAKAEAERVREQVQNIE